MHARMTPEARKARAASAHASLRGQTQPEERVRRRVAGQAGKLKSPLEKLVYARLCELSTAPEPGFQVGRYLVDMAFPRCKVALEVDGENWHTSSRKIAQDTRKTAYLETQGWAVTRIRERDVPRLSEIVAQLKLAGPNPTAP